MSIWPPIVWIILQVGSIGFNASKGGASMLSALIAAALGGALLWWGSFFVPLLH